MSGKNANLVLVIALIAVAAFSRFLFAGMPNFSPVMAMALFGGAMLNKKLAYVIPVAAMLLTDIYFGFHNTMFAVYGSFLLTVLIGQKFVSNPNIKNVAASSVVSALLFFVVTNFAVWAMSGMYTLDFSGLVACYVAAIPFFKSTLASSMLFSAIIFGTYAISEKLAAKPATAEIK